MLELVNELENYKVKKMNPEYRFILNKIEVLVILGLNSEIIPIVPQDISENYHQRDFITGNG